MGWDASTTMKQAGGPMGWDAHTRMKWQEAQWVGMQLLRMWDVCCVCLLGFQKRTILIGQIIIPTLA